MLAALMAVSMLTGCSGRPDNAKNNSAADDSKKKTEKIIYIKSTHRRGNSENEQCSV